MPKISKPFFEVLAWMASIGLTVLSISDINNSKSKNIAKFISPASKNIK